MDAMEILLKKNKHLVKKIAKRNTLRNAEGKIIFDKNDPWVKDNSWDELYKKVCAND